MEIPRKHDNKKNIKTLNIGSGGLGICGVLLLGGALVTATIVSTLAFRSRSQRRSTSENTKKKMSTSLETQSVDAPKSLEVTMDTDFSPSEEVTSMKEIHTKSIQSLTMDKKHDEQVHSGDGNEDIIDSVVVEYQENTTIREEQVVMVVSDEHVDASSLVSDESVVSIEEYETIEVPVKDTAAEASKNENENDDEDGEDHQETILMKAASAAAVEAACMNQIKVEDNLHVEITMENSEGDLSDETGYADHIVHEVLTEEDAIDAARLLQNEAQNCDRVQLLDGQDEIVLEDCDGDLSNKKGPAQILREGDGQMECSGKQVMVDHEVTPDAQEMQVNEICETFVVACVMNQLKEAVDDQTAANEDIPPSQSINKIEKDKETAQKVEEQVTIEDEAAKVDMITKHELVKKDEISHVETVKKDEDSEEDVMVKVKLSSGVSSSSMQEEPTPEAKISNHKIKETAVMITDHELVKKDEIRHVESVTEDEDNEEDVTVIAELSSGVSSSFMQEEPTPDARIYNNNEETAEQFKVEMTTDHKLVKKDEIRHVESVTEDEDNEEDVTVIAELSSGVSSSSMQEEPTPDARIYNNNEETAEQFKVEMTTDHKLVEKDEIPHVESVKEDEHSEEDVTVKAELNSGVGSPSVQEERILEEKIDNHKIEENVEENQTFLGKNHNHSEEDVTVKAELSYGSGVGSPSVQEEPIPETKISNHKIEENVEENQTYLGKNHNDSEKDVTVKAELNSGVSSPSVQEEPTLETMISNRNIEENMDENQTILGKNYNDSDDNGVIKEQAFASEPWNLKLMAWSVLLSVWCLCHWYSELPFPELSLIGSLLFILILFGYRNRATTSSFLS